MSSDLRNYDVGRGVNIVLVRLSCPGEESALRSVQGCGLHCGRPVHPHAEGHGPGAGRNRQISAAEGRGDQRLHQARRGRSAGQHGAALHPQPQH